MYKSILLSRTKVSNKNKHVKYYSDFINAPIRAQKTQYFFFFLPSCTGSSTQKFQQQKKAA